MDDFNLLRDLRRPYRPLPDEAHAHTNFRAEVAAHTLEDPLATLTNLSRDTGIPMGALIRYVLCRWTASGAEALLAMGPVTVQQMEAIVAKAEASGTPDAKGEAFDSLSSIVRWLRSGFETPARRVS